MMRKTSLILLSAAAGVAGTLVATQPRLFLEGARAQAAAADRQLGLFVGVFERVRADYVERPDDAKLIESAINGMLSGLDPHSSYMDAKSFRGMQVETRGEFGGLGIEVTMEQGLVKVVAPIDETPAAKAGIMANDIITHLNDEPVQGLTLDQAVEKMRGPVKTKINLKIMRKAQDKGQDKSQEKPVEVSITREIIRVRPVRARLEGDDVGFIRVTQFNEQTADGLKKAIADLTAQSRDKLRGFIIDLRNNPGGLLDQAIAVSDAFLEKGEIVLNPRPQCPGYAAVQRAPGRSHARQADDCFDKRWLGFCFRDRGWRSAGSPPRDGHRYPLLRQGIGADHHPARFHRRRVAADDCTLLQTVRPIDPGERHLARY